MKKLFFVLLISAALGAKAFSSEVLAPAVQFDTENYKNYFSKTTDYKVNVKSRSDYIITCDSDIIGVIWGDTENIKMYDIENDFGEIADMKSVIMKTKYETYTYVRLYKYSKEIVNLILSVNPVYPADGEISLGLCKLLPYRG